MASQIGTAPAYVVAFWRNNGWVNRYFYPTEQEAKRYAEEEVRSERRPSTGSIQ